MFWEWAWGCEELVCVGDALWSGLWLDWGVTLVGRYEKQAGDGWTLQVWSQSLLCDLEWTELACEGLHPGHVELWQAEVGHCH